MSHNPFDPRYQHIHDSELANLRAMLGQTPEEFAELIGITVDQLREYEEMREEPPLYLLNLAYREADLVIRREDGFGGY